MFEELKRYDEAREEFLHALKLDATNGRAHTNMANLLKIHYKNYQDAAKHYQEAIRLDEKNATKHFNYGVLNAGFFFWLFVVFFCDFVC